MDLHDPHPVWDQMSVHHRCERAEVLPFAVETRTGGEAMLLLPNDKAQLRELIRFINEDIFRSILTAELHYAGSKAKLDG